MNALFQLYWANLTEFLSNRRALFLTVAFPILFIVIFGLVFTNQEKQSATIGVIVRDTGEVGPQILNGLQEMTKAKVPEPTKDGKPAPKTGLGKPGGDEDSNPFSEIVFEQGDAKILEESLRLGKVDAVLSIHENTTEAVTEGDPVALTLQIDSSRQTLIPLLRGGMSVILEQMNSQITGQDPLITLKTVNARSRNLRTIDYLLPGILAMSIMQLGLFATAQPLIALRVTGVLKQLGATPLKRSTLLTAYIAMRLTVALLQTALIVGIGTLAFKVAVVGSWVSLAGWLFLGTLTFLALGFLIASVAKNEESAIAIANVINLPMLLLSGVFFPVSHLPHFLEYLVDLVPLNYLADALRQVMVDATPQHTMMTNAIALVIWTIVFTLFAIRFFRWEERR
jgi:ABC-2 type transport system permease protein